MFVLMGAGLVGLIVGSTAALVSRLSRAWVCVGAFVSLCVIAAAAEMLSHRLSDVRSEAPIIGASALIAALICFGAFAVGRAVRGRTSSEDTPR